MKVGEWNWRQIGLCIIVLQPILSFGLASVSIILLALIGLYSTWESRSYDRSNLIKKTGIAAVLSCYFVLQLLSLVYTENLAHAFKNIQNSLSLLLLPLILVVLYRPISKKQLDLLLLLFVLSSVVLSFYVGLEFWVEQVGNSADLGNKWGGAFRESVSDLLLYHLHPTYFSIWVLFSCIVLSNFLLNKIYPTLFWVFIGTWIFLFFIALLLVSRGVLAAFFIASFFQIILHFRKKVKTLLILSFGGVLLLVGLSQMNSVRVRFYDEVFAQEFTPPVGNAHTPTNIRVGIYSCVFEIFKSNVFFGLGIGDVQDNLNDCYLQYHTRVYQENHYNAHSSYFQLMLSTGAIGLLLFLAVHVYLIRLAFRKENYIFAIFLLYIMGSMAFESILERMHGAFFYACFLGLFFNYQMGIQRDPEQE